MKRKIKLIVATALLLASAALMCSCFGDESPYSEYDERGYTVSVKYDANGGSFTTNTSVIVDSYKVSGAKNEIALLSPDDGQRGDVNAFYATKSGYVLAGWYTERTAVCDSKGNHLDANGNIAALSGAEPLYTYSGKWDFKNGRVSLDPNKTYSATEPVITLYAAWVPQFSFEFYSLDTGELLDTVAFDPTYSVSLRVPEWNTKTGKLEMYDFPEIDGMTFDKVYLDPAGENLVLDAEITHGGSIDYSSATAKAPVKKLYVDMMPGEWYQIYTAEQFVDNASLGASFRIMNDLDFSEEIWPSFLTGGNFSGCIMGNGYKISNVTLEQIDNSQVNSGLFGQLVSGAYLSELTFENISVTVKSGSRMNGATFGTLAGTLSEDAIIEDVAMVNVRLQISPSALIGETASIGLLCGTGDTKGIDISDISCVALQPTDTYTAPIEVAVDGNTVTVEISDEY